MSAAPILEVAGLEKHFGGVRATDGVDLMLREGETHAVIGPNGAGKTTLIALLTGEIAPDAGVIRLMGRDVAHLPPHARALAGMARSYQITSVFPAMSVLENVALAVQAHAGHSFHFWRPAAREVALEEKARAALAIVELEDAAETRAGALAHGRQRQLELAMALAAEAPLLLLDEPLAGMGAEESRRMVEILGRLRGRSTLLLIEHDMDAVFALADRISVLVSGRVIATGAPAEIRADPVVRRAYLGEAAE